MLMGDLMETLRAQAATSTYTVSVPCELGVILRPFHFWNNAVCMQSTATTLHNCQANITVVLAQTVTKPAQALVLDVQQQALNTSSDSFFNTADQKKLGLYMFAGANPVAIGCITQQCDQSKVLTFCLTNATYAASESVDISNPPRPAIPKGDAFVI